MSERKTTRLYRIENPNIEANQTRFGSVSHPELVGQWFTPRFDQAMIYLKKSTRTRKNDKSVLVDGVQILFADIDNEELPRYLAENDERIWSMDTEGDNYLLPRDGTINITILALDGILNELRENIGNIDNYKEAHIRITKAISEFESLK